MLQAFIGTLVGVGVFLCLMDLKAIPYVKTSQAVENIAKRKKNASSVLDIWLGGLSEWLSKFIRMNEFKKEQLQSDLETAGMEITPERYQADAIVKSGLIAVLAIPVGFILPIGIPFVLFLAFVLYLLETKKVTKKIAEKREKIEYELPRLVFTISKTLQHNRDILYMLDSYRETAGPELKSELDVTVADMKSSGYEGAIVRLDSRVGSPMMSRVCRGLIGILKGGDTLFYWESLSLDFSNYQKQQLMRRAQKIPSKVRRLSMCLLVCFMLIYVVVILAQIMDSIGILFQ